VICVFVAVNESVRASRLRDRDHITMEEVKELEMHSTENEVSSLKAIADFSIDNSQSVDLAVSEFVSKLAEQQAIGRLSRGIGEGAPDAGAEP